MVRIRSKRIDEALRAALSAEIRARKDPAPQSGICEKKSDWYQQDQPWRAPTCRTRSNRRFRRCPPNSVVAESRARRNGIAETNVLMGGEVTQYTCRENRKTELTRVIPAR